MKCKKLCKFSQLFMIAISLMLVISAVIPVNTSGDPDEDEGYTVRDPIRIDGNDDFAAQAAAEGWPGDGSEGDPYVIKGYEIDGTGHGYGIYVGNTTVHFVVRGCYIHNVTGKDGTQEQSTGIYLYKVNNGRFEDNILYNRFGFVLWYSENNLIHNNTITCVYGSSIHLWWSDYNTISNNYIINSRDEPSFAGIGILCSEYNVIAYNHISGFKFGIDVEHDGTYGVNENLNNTFVDVEIEYNEGISIEYNNDNNSTSLGFSHIITLILVVSISVAIIGVMIYKKKGKKR